MPTEETIRIAEEVRETHARSALTSRQAKLYSQRLRREMGQDGLASFSMGDVEIYLDEAMLLLHCALIERDSDPSGSWREGVKRAGEILEWLSQPDLKPAQVPMHFLSAAAYQLAGFPAMVSGLLRRMPDNEPFSELLREFLRADFPATLKATQAFWKNQLALEVDGLNPQEDLSVLTIRHTVMCIGTVCTYFRNGDYGTVEIALHKLDRIATSFLHSRDRFSYLLARLTAAICRVYVETCLWPQIDALRHVSNPRSGEALEQFARSAFINNRALVWPSQKAGIERLRQNTSFALCTPTGSGKTTVATLAIIQELFTDHVAQGLGLEATSPGNLILYMVPSRALAAEVEARLAQDLSGIAADPIVVTGLYGGVDWGPTDAWTETAQPTIVICTFEKADALLRYLGVSFLERLRLVVIDEAHMVEQDLAWLSSLKDGGSRSYRVEQLGTRLLQAQDVYGYRLVALSAVAASAAPALARWVGADAGASPATSDYRSTRQMLGRLEVGTQGKFTIQYNLMDGHSLEFEDERPGEIPFVPEPIPRMPGGIQLGDGPEVRMRAPTFWAALHLAAERPDGTRPSVLISLTQAIHHFASTCADRLEDWPTEQLPNYHSVDVEDDKWTRCLASAADYFTTDSVEYRLLERGVAVHHGKMPGLLARRLKEMIDCGYVRVIIATSTLSEGVNLPINYLLIPSVYRSNEVLSLQEFTNLIGRAGRPGMATEGHALVVLPEREYDRNPRGIRRPRWNRQWNGYEHLTSAIERTTVAGGQIQEDTASSALAHLLEALEEAWRDLTGGGTAQEFSDWLENTSVTEQPDNAPDALLYLDSLDAFLLAAIQEVEEMRGEDLVPDTVEAELIQIWQRTFAAAAAQEEVRLRQIWLDRGQAIKSHYPEAAKRRRIYKTSLSPRSAEKLLSQTESIKAKLSEGVSFATWEDEERLTFVQDVLALLSEVPSFKIETSLGRRRNFTDWPKLLRWWIAKDTLPTYPQPNEIADWYYFVSDNFIYRGAWGLGSVLGLVLDQGDGGEPVNATEIENWPRTGLPWIAFWLKELITWGTLDPVAAFLLARGNAIDRPQAEADARDYYSGLPEDLDPNDILDPLRIRNWVVDTRQRHAEREEPMGELTFDTELEREPGDYIRTRLSVSPIDVGEQLIWIDPGGYTVARCEKPARWTDTFADFDFELNVNQASVIGKPYLPHA